MTEPSPKLVAVGDNCLDVYLSKDVLTVGGNALNVAVQWRRHGWESRYFGAVGNDEESDIVLAELGNAGFPPADVERCGGDTAVTFLRDDNGDRTFLLEALGVGGNYMPDFARYNVIAAASWVHLGTNSNADLVRRLIADDVSFSIDISTTHFALPLDNVPLVFASGSGHADMPIEDLVQHLRKAGMRQLVVTCGSEGAYFDDGREIHHAPATLVDVVDTCGAGDSFIATFLTAYHFEKRGAVEALRRASAAAAQTCLHLGGFPQEPRPVSRALLAKYADHIAPVQGV